MSEQIASYIIQEFPFFYPITDTDKGMKSLKYVYESNVYDFKIYSSKTIQSGTLKMMSEGLNHLLMYFKDINLEETTSEIELKRQIEKIEFKRNFLIQLTIYLQVLHETLTGPKFAELCNSKLVEATKNVYGKLPTIQDIHSDILDEWAIKFVENPILMRGILLYVYDCTNFNSVNNRKGSENNLNEYDLFVITAVICIARFIHTAFSVLPNSSKADTIVIKPIYTLLSVVNTKVYEFYRDELSASPMTLQKIGHNSAETNIIDYISNIIDKHWNSENNKNVFENLGISEAASKNRVLKTLLTSIFKILPAYDVGDAKKSAPIYYEYQEDWYNYKYVSNCVIMYVKNTIKSIHANNNKHCTRAISKVLIDGSSDNNISYRQEMFLESRDNVALTRKKSIVRALKQYAEEEILNSGPIPDHDTNIQITNSPFKEYILTTILNELDEDIISVKLIDSATMSSILICMYHRLNKLGYPKLANALVASGTTGQYNVSIDHLMDKISVLSKYRINPSKLERYIRDVIGRKYIPQSSKLEPIDISEEFVDLLYQKNNKTISLLDMNNTCWNYTHI